MWLYVWYGVKQGRGGVWNVDYWQYCSACLGVGFWLSKSFFG